MVGQQGYALVFLVSYLCCITALSIEVVGGSGRIGSQCLRLLGDSGQLVPRGTPPGKLSTPKSPILICTPSAVWGTIYDETIANRQSDLVFIGNGNVIPGTTLVLPHYSVAIPGGPTTVRLDGPPTFIQGPHAGFMRQLLHLDGVHCEILVDGAIQSRVVLKVLWASLFWLLCHGVKEDPVSIEDILRDHQSDLDHLILELWPATLSLMEETPSIPWDEAYEYLLSYARSVGRATPSWKLAMAELSDRNGRLLRTNQKFHNELLERVLDPDVYENLVKGRR